MGKLNRRRIPDDPNHWNRIKLDENSCFVCDKSFRKNQKKIPIGSKNGIALYRHEACDCNSTNWKKKFQGCKTLPMERG